MPLNLKMEMFCQEYVIDFNGARAALAAGYSKKANRDAAHRLLHSPEIKERIKELQGQVAERLGLSRERILAELAAIAFSDTRKLYNVDGALLQINMIGNDIAPALAAVETKDLYAGEMHIGQTSKVKMWDKLSAIETINKMLGYNAPEKKELSNPDGTLTPIAAVAPMTDTQVNKILLALKNKSARKK